MKDNNYNKNPYEFNGRDMRDEDLQQQRMNELDIRINRCMHELDIFIEQLSRGFAIEKPIINQQPLNYEDIKNQTYKETSFLVSGSYYQERQQNEKLLIMEHHIKNINQKYKVPRQIATQAGLNIANTPGVSQDSISFKQWGDFFNAGLFGAQRNQNDKMTAMESFLDGVDKELSTVKQSIAHEMHNCILESNYERFDKILNVDPFFLSYKNKSGKTGLELVYEKQEQEPRLWASATSHYSQYAANTRFSDGKTPLQRAVQDGKSGAIDKLCGMGADVTLGLGTNNICSEPTLLHDAIEKGDRNVVSALLRNRANTNGCLQDGSFTQNNWAWLCRTVCCGSVTGKTPLHAAAEKYINLAKSNAGTVSEKNAENILKDLITHEANPDIKNLEGKTAADLLREAGFNKLAAEISVPQVAQIASTQATNTSLPPVRRGERMER